MSAFPHLYQGAQPPDSLPAEAHPGLWFERFFNAFEHDGNGIAISETRRSDWLNSFKTAGHPDALTAKALRLIQLAQARGGQWRVYVCAGNFVTGMGNAHPLENGFAWHHTLGAPYLPGSAVKGLARAVVETAYAGTDQADVLRRWFGTASKEDVPEQQGQFIFLDALPVKPCPLRPEVMTPHTGKWQEQGGTRPDSIDAQPGDWHSPVPVSYLTARGLALQFTVLPAPELAANKAHCQQEFENLWQALEYGLAEMGAGGKTSTGFGLMTPCKEEQDKLQEKHDEIRRKNEKATLTPNMQQVQTYADEMEQLLAKFPRFKKEQPNGALYQKARNLAHAAKTDNWRDEEKRSAAEAIEKWLPKVVRIESIQKELRKLGIDGFGKSSA